MSVRRKSAKERRPRGLARYGHGVNAKVRTCLKCNREFWSEGPGNRNCGCIHPTDYRFSKAEAGHKAVMSRGKCTDG